MAPLLAMATQKPVGPLWPHNSQPQQAWKGGKGLVGSHLSLPGLHATGGHRRSGSNAQKVAAAVDDGAWLIRPCRCMPLEECMFLHWEAAA